ncbi:MAG: cell division protein FtsZ, partial [Betaproteobacteria bacterium]|nr:cell division protein FtsZ [Betaproteobacteria bacterium]
AVRSPLLEDVNLAGARGVLVNVTASSGLRMREYHEVMTTIKEFTADDALVIVGTVIDDSMDDRLRVTMIATGLGGVQGAKREQKAPSMTLVEQPQVVARTGTDGVGVSVGSVDYGNLEAPAVIRKRERGVPAPSAFDSTEIPAFLRKQAD